LLARGYGWQTLWLASGALSLVALLAAAALLPRGGGTTDWAGGQAGGAPNPALRRFITAYGLYGFGYIITATFLVEIVRAAPAIREWEPVIWVVFGLAAAPSVTLWTRIARPLGIPAAFALACVVEAAGVLSSVAWQNTAGVFVAALLVGGTFMGLTALGLVGARNLATGDPRRALALITGAFGLGQIVGPAFAGIVSDLLGSFTTPSIAAAVALLVAAVLAAK
jgi:predicted MFS family arabinose efflux permease